MDWCKIVYSYHFERSDANKPPYFGNAFDDYYLSTINWLIGLSKYPHIIDKWVREKTYAQTMENYFHNRRFIHTDEVTRFVNLFTDFIPYAPYFTDEQREQLKKDINLVVEIIKSYA